ncbi:hypothetical protein HMPREF1557_00934 [Streptococcus sobrinus W1703]|uniref:Uncharacterized protein n=1 Tax=Streptococcus sobrinus W1703 TaxID=1227275 RepID=U2J8Z7_9STRE|nr:hypothetical protein HMPREF1557_00934 [Streptococcus sobrinus W1703]
MSTSFPLRKCPCSGLSELRKLLTIMVRLFGGQFVVTFSQPAIDQS